MNQNVTKEFEREYKSLLKGKDHFDTITKQVLMFATFESAYTQINHYFDTIDHAFKKSGVTLRIREKGDDWVLTAKKGVKGRKDVAVSEETHMVLNKGQALSYIDLGIPFNHPIFNEIGMHTNEPVTHIGSLTTERSDYRYQNDTISLDVNHYSGIIDYEFEWESSNDQFVNQVNLILGLHFGNANGKKGRFLRTITK